MITYNYFYVFTVVCSFLIVLNIIINLKMAHTNEENVFPYEKTLLNTIVKNTKETKVIQFY